MMIDVRFEVVGSHVPEIEMRAQETLERLFGSTDDLDITVDVVPVGDRMWRAEVVAHRPEKEN